MAQYPIDFLKRDTAQRFFPVTHPSAVLDGQKNILQIFGDGLKTKASKIIEENGNTIFINPFIGKIDAGIGVLAIGLPVISDSAVLFFDIYGSNGGTDFVINLSAETRTGTWYKGSAFCTNTEPVKGLIRLGEYNNQKFILLAHNTAAWDIGIFGINMSVINNTVDNLLTGYSLEIINNTGGFSTIVDVPINASFSVGDADSVNGWRVDDTKGGTDNQDDNALWTAFNIRNRLDDKADKDNVYTIEEMDDKLTLKANVDDVYTKDNVNTLLEDYTPIYHANNEDIYGVGDDEFYGHLKLSDATNINNGIADGIAATPKAVKDVYDFANNIHDSMLMGFEERIPNRVFLEDAYIICDISDLQSIIDNLPKHLNRNYIINVNEGSITEDIIIEYFSGAGYLFITGATSTTTTHSVSRIIVHHCTNPVITLRGFNLTATDGICADISSSIRCTIINFNIVAGESTTSGFWGVRYTQVLNGQIYNCNISNKNVALRTDGGTVEAFGLDGLGNNIIYQTAYLGYITRRNEGTITGTTVNSVTNSRMYDATHSSGWHVQNGLNPSARTISNIEMSDLQNTINALPRYLDRNVTLNVLAGTSLSAITVTRFSGPGTLTIYGASAIATTHNIPNLTVSYCNNAQINISGFNITNTTGICCYVDSCSTMRVSLTYLNIIAGTPISGHEGIRVSVSTMVIISTCTISNKQYAIRAVNSGRVLSYNNAGSGNTNINQTGSGGVIQEQNIGTITSTGIKNSISDGQVFDGIHGNGWIIQNGNRPGTRTIDNIAMADLQTVLNSLPKYLDRSIILNVLAGTIATDISVNGFAGPGILTINGATAIGTTHQCNRFYVQNCVNERVHVRGFRCTATTGDIFVTDVKTFSYFQWISAIAGSSATSGHRGFVAQTGANFQINDAMFSNKNTAITCDGGRGEVLSLSGSSNNLVLAAIYGGIIHRRELGSIAGTTQGAVANGGLIVAQNGAILGA